MTHPSPSTGVPGPAGRWRHPPADRWRDCPAALKLGQGDVHVWRVHLDHAAWSLEQLTGALSPDEHERASTFALARDRRRFRVSRGVLRLLLAGYVDRAPHAIDLRDGPSGKPELAAPSGDPRVEFNCSHSHGLALYAFAAGRRVGIDLEALRHLPEVAGIAELCFSPRERSELAALPRGGLDEAVLRGWTMKEAYVKAVGDGLARPLDGIEVAVSPTEPSALCAIDGDSEMADRWSLRTLSPEAGYAAALVVEGHGYVLTCWAGQPATPTLRSV